ncbi:MAG: hypothetical protein DI628_07120 [Blastochloris viridis]|uniref:Uncharacterized protein n=1 Tax=Blastochloris viridis TaxID=1079 RepID=A0A6N4R4Q7_BLAVI|nr:MAG: hypothetical protein DI628_07120 [Blastochloris viridis]
MLKKLLTCASAALITAAMLSTSAHADLRRSGQAAWDVYQGRLGLKIGGNASMIFGNETYCSRGQVQNMVYGHYNQNVEFVGNMSSLIGRMNGSWGGSGDSDGYVLADVFDCGVSLGGRLSGAVCVSLDIMQPMGTRYCAYGTQE